MIQKEHLTLFDQFNASVLSDIDGSFNCVPFSFEVWISIDENQKKSHIQIWTIS